MLRRTPLKQRTPLKAKKPLKSHTRINPVSKKQAANNKQNALQKAKLLVKQIEEKGHTYCTLCGQQKHMDQLELVHITGKGRGGHPTDPGNQCIGCIDCHRGGPKMGYHYNKSTEECDETQADLCCDRD